MRQHSTFRQTSAHSSSFSSTTRARKSPRGQKRLSVYNGSTCVGRTERGKYAAAAAVAQNRRVMNRCCRLARRLQQPERPAINHPARTIFISPTLRRNGGQRWNVSCALSRLRREDTSRRRSSIFTSRLHRRLAGARDAVYLDPTLAVPCVSVW